LADVREVTAQRCEGPLAQIAAEHKDFAFVGLVVAEKKPEQRAFSGAAGAHYGNRLPKVYFETHTGQRRLGTPGVGESDVSKLDGRVTRVRGEVGAVFAFYRCIQEVDYPSGRSGFGSDLCEKTRQPLHGEGHVELEGVVFPYRVDDAFEAFGEPRSRAGE
jgi:hypothetical protein